MVKKRVRPTATPSKDAIEAFASGADTLSPPLNKNASRNFKAIRVPFNEYEYLKLEEASKKTGRTKLNFIRRAILQLADKEK